VWLKCNNCGMFGGSTSGAASSHESLAALSAGDHSRKPHYGYANSSARASSSPPPLFRSSLLREVLREIRNCLRRIGEIRRRALDRQGISIDPLPEIAAPCARESGSACCIRDMQNLYNVRPATTLIDAELFLQGWTCGAAWNLGRTHSELPGGAHP
jgi:hypothetical protein